MNQPTAPWSKPPNPRVLHEHSEIDMQELPGCCSHGSHPTATEMPNAQPPPPENVLPPFSQIGCCEAGVEVSSWCTRVGQAPVLPAWVMVPALSRSASLASISSFKPAPTLTQLTVFLLNDSQRERLEANIDNAVNDRTDYCWWDNNRYHVVAYYV